MPDRADGRENEGTLRPLACELSCLHRADGSALWKAGSTHVMAAVYGPIAPLILNKEETVGLVSLVIKSGGKHEQTTIEFEWGDFLNRILSSCIDRQRYPRTVVEIVLHIIQADGSVLSCLLHAAVAALMDAGVDLLYLPVATTCLLSSNNSSSNSAIFLDPTSAEEEEKDSTVLVLVNESSRSDQVLGSHTVGPGISLEQFLASTQLASKACPAIVAFWRLAVEQKVTRESQTLWSK